MSELGTYLREQFEEIVDPIDIDALVGELEAGKRSAAPLPPLPRDRRRGLLIAAAAAIVVLIAGAAWLLFGLTDVPPADHPLDETEAIAVVEHLFDTVNRNAFDAYLGLVGTDHVRLEGMTLGCGDHWCEEGESPGVEQTRDNVRALMAFSLELEGAWEINTCWTPGTAASVTGIAVTCNVSYTSGAGRLIPIPPQHHTFHFRVTGEGIDVIGPVMTQLDLSRLWEWAVDDIEANGGADPCNVTYVEDAPVRFDQACSDWVWERIDAMYGF